MARRRLRFAQGAASGTVIAAISGLATGKTIDTFVPNDGRLALDGSRRNLLVGLSASAAGAVAATLTTSTGRTLAMAITVQCAPAYLGVVSTRGQIPFAILTGAPSLRSCKYVYARDDITSLQLLYGNWYASNGPDYAEHTTGGVMAIRVGIEYPLGTFTRVLFSGVRDGRIADGANLLSDALAKVIPTGAIFGIWSLQSHTAGVIYSDLKGHPNDKLQHAGSALSDTTLGGTITPTIALGNFGPIAVLAQTCKTSVITYGDSRAVGYNEQTTGPDSTGDIGEVNRAVGAAFGYIDTSGSGHRAAHFIASGKKRAALAQYVSHPLVQLGVNDFLGGGRTDVAVRTSINSLLAMLPSGKSVWLNTVVPFVSTITGSWPTPTTQTVAGNNANLAAHNNWRRTVPAGFAGCHETADLMETARGSGTLKNGLFHDGTHETAAGMQVVKTGINTSLMVRV